MKYLTQICICKSITGILQNEIAEQYKKGYKYPYPVKRKRNALDDLMNLECKKKDKSEISSDLYSEIDEDKTKTVEEQFTDSYGSDSTGNCTPFANRTGIFSLDFPPSPKVPKGKRKKMRVTIKSPEPPTSDSDCMMILLTQTQELTVTGTTDLNSDSDIVIQPSGFVTKC